MSHLIQSGTYVPVVTLNGAGTAPQYSTATGIWKTSGSVCWVDIYLTGDGGNEGAGAGQILVSIPFVVGPSQLPINIVAGSSINNISEYSLYATLTSGLQSVALQRLVSATQLGNFTGADQNNTTRSIRLSLKIVIN